MRLAVAFFTLQGSARAVAGCQYHFGVATLGLAPNIKSMDPTIFARSARAAQAAQDASKMGESGQKPASTVPIRKIGAAFAPQITIHLLELNERDRYLRFGYAATDEQIRRYVDGIDYGRDPLFGIFNRKLQLIGVAHLAMPADSEAADGAEFGVSISGHARGRGYGSQLFERAALYAVNQGIDTLHIQALSENKVMLGIAQKAGAIIERHGSESQACLRLPEASFRTRLNELLAQQVAKVDYWLKKETVHRSPSD